MNIKVKFDAPYTGAVHSRDHRIPACMALGDGTDMVAFSVNLLAKQGSPDYCGVLVSNVSGNNVSSSNNNLLISLKLKHKKFLLPMNF